MLRSQVVRTTIAAISIVSVCQVGSLRFFMARERSDLRTDISSSVMPRWASARIALAVVAQRSAVSRAFGVGITIFCLLS